jgi:hypothetical protein
MNLPLIKRCHFEEMDIKDCAYVASRLEYESQMHILLQRTKKHCQKFVAACVAMTIDFAMFLAIIFSHSAYYRQYGTRMPMTLFVIAWIWAVWNLVLYQMGKKVLDEQTGVQPYPIHCVMYKDKTFTFKCSLSGKDEIVNSPDLRLTS